MYVSYVSFVRGVSYGELILFTGDLKTKKMKKQLSAINKKRLELLEDTVKYYSVSPVDRRCTDGGTCNYHPATLGMQETSEGCAVGRLLSRRMAARFDSYGEKSVTELFVDLPKKLQKYGGAFLQNLQSFHDTDHYWNSKGLSVTGKTQVKILKKRITNNYYDSLC